MDIQNAEIEFNENAIVALDANEIDEVSGAFFGLITIGFGLIGAIFGGHGGHGGHGGCCTPPPPPKPNC